MVPLSQGIFRIVLAVSLIPVYSDKQAFHTWQYLELLWYFKILIPMPLKIRMDRVDLNLGEP